MLNPIFQSTDHPPECSWKRLIVNGSCSFEWEPGLTINGETCMSTDMVEYGEYLKETINTHELVEKIRLAWLGYT